MHHRVDQRDVGAAPLAHRRVGVPVQLDEARVADDKLGPRAHAFFDHRADDRVGLRRVGADHHDCIGMFDRFIVVCHRAASEGLAETRHRSGVSEVGAVVDVVGGHHLAREALHEIVFLVRTAG